MNAGKENRKALKDRIAQQHLKTSNKEGEIKEREERRGKEKDLVINKDSGGEKGKQNSIRKDSYG